MGVNRRIILLASKGESDEVIARETGVPLGAVRLILRSPLAQGEVLRAERAT